MPEHKQNTSPNEAQTPPKAKKQVSIYATYGLSGAIGKVGYEGSTELNSRNPYLYWMHQPAEMRSSNYEGGVQIKETQPHSELTYKIGAVQKNRVVQSHQSEVTLTQNHETFDIDVIASGETVTRNLASEKARLAKTTFTGVNASIEKRFGSASEHALIAGFKAAAGVMKSTVDTEPLKQLTRSNYFDPRHIPNKTVENNFAGAMGATVGVGETKNWPGVKLDAGYCMGGDVQISDVGLSLYKSIPITKSGGKVSVQGGYNITATSIYHTTPDGYNRLTTMEPFHGPNASLRLTLPLGKGK